MAFGWRWMALDGVFVRQRKVLDSDTRESGHFPWSESTAKGEFQEFSEPWHVVAPGIL